MTEFKIYISPLIQYEFPIKFLNNEQLNELITKYNLTEVGFDSEIIPENNHFQRITPNQDIPSSDDFTDDLFYAFTQESDITINKLIMVSKLFDLTYNKEYFRNIKQFVPIITKINVENKIYKGNTIRQVADFMKKLAEFYKIKEGTKQPTDAPITISSDITNKLLFSHENKNNRLSINDYILPNRKIFPLFIKSTFQTNVNKFQFQPIKIWNPKNQQFDERIPFNQQKFVSYFLSQNTPYRGLLLYHGLGSGKTGASIMIAEGFRDRQIVILLPASLRTNYENEILNFGEVAYKKQFYWEFVQIPYDTINNTIDNRAMKTLENIGIPLNLINEIVVNRNDKYGIFMIKYDASSPNYDKLSEEDRVLLNKQINIMLQWKYTILHYNAGVFTIPKILEKCYGTTRYRQLLQEVFNSPVKAEFSVYSISSLLNHIFNPNNNYENPFDNKVVIVDEVHNITSHLTGNGYVSNYLYELIMRAKNCKLVFLSGTPVINNSYELALLFNMLNGFIHEYSLPLTITNGIINKDELYKLLIKSDYIDRLTFDLIFPKSITIKFTLVPYKFKNNIINGQYDGVKLIDENINDYDKINSIIDLLKKNNYKTDFNSIKEKIYTLFPDILNQNGYIPSNLEKNNPNKITTTKLDQKFIMGTSRNIKMQSDFNFRTNNYYMYTFSDRIQGLVSFYNEIAGIDKTTGYNLFPEKIDASPNLTEVIMSDYQFIDYCIYRTKEQIQEEKSKELQRLSQTEKYKNIDFGNIPNSFRVFSRQIGIFTFPPNIQRPKRSTNKIYNKIFTISELQAILYNFIANSSIEERYNKIDKFVKRIERSNITPIISILKTVYPNNTQNFNSIDLFKNIIFTVTPNIDAIKTKEQPEITLENIEDDIQTNEDENVEEEGTVIISEACDSNYGECSPKENEIEIAYEYQIKNSIQQLTNENLTIPKTQTDISQSYKYTLDVLSPKYAKILENINNTPGLVLCYSQYRTLEGIELLARVLVANGYTSYTTNVERLTIRIGMKVRYTKDNINWITGTITGGGISKKSGEHLFYIDNDLTKQYKRHQIYPCQFALWTGTETTDIRKSTLDDFNKDENMYGQKCLILMITQSGAEGISLFNTRQVHILEPYWNNVRIRQVIGRARRIRSHIKLPKEQQNVMIYKYTIKFSEAQLNMTWYKNVEREVLYKKMKEFFEKNEIEDREFNTFIQIWNKTILKDYKLTSDETLNILSSEKDKIVDAYTTKMKAAAIDCDFNKNDNIKSDPSLKDLTCYQNLVNSGVDPFIYDYNVTLEKTIKEEQTPIISNITTIITASYPNPVNKQQLISVSFRIDAPSNKPVSMMDIVENMPVFDDTNEKIIGSVSKVAIVDNKHKMAIRFLPEFIKSLSK
jgi:hypothetical protein